MNTTEISIADVESSLLDIELMLRTAITDGTVLKVMKEQRQKIVSNLKN
jgi:hypothetical protein